MKIIKTDPPANLPGAEEFVWREKTVQGARTGSCGDLLCVRSPRRFKLYARSSDTVFFLQGSGHFKWARGETPFSAGDCFLVEGEGEYEVNGCSEFIIVTRIP